jgi:hypothetical protein
MYRLEVDLVKVCAEGRSAEHARVTLGEMSLHGGLHIPVSHRVVMFGII